METIRDISTPRLVCGDVITQYVRSSRDNGAVRPRQIKIQGITLRTTLRRGQQVTVYYLEGVDLDTRQVIHLADAPEHYWRTWRSA